MPIDETITSVLETADSPWDAVLVVVLCLTLIVWKLGPKLPKLNFGGSNVTSNAASLSQGNGSKPITIDAVNAKLLEHCERCGKIPEIKKEISAMREETSNGLSGMREEMNNGLSELRKTNQEILLLLAKK